MNSSPAPSAAARSKETVSTRPSRVWPILFAVSLLGNIALGWFAFTARPKVPAAASVPVTVNTPSASQPAAPPQPGRPAVALLPYAALGSFMAENNRIPDLNWNEEQFAAFLNGVRASYEGRGYPMDEDAKRLRDEINGKVQKMLAADHPDPVEDYFKTLREKEHVLQTPSGLHYRITEQGTGKQATADSMVLISYSAKLPSGESLPTLTRMRVRSAVSDLLPGLREGVQLLKTGGKALVYVPADLSFGSGEWPADVPHGAPIVFFLELHEVTEKD